MNDQKHMIALITILSTHFWLLNNLHSEYYHYHLKWIPNSTNHNKKKISDRTEIKHGLPKRSSVEPFLFNTDMIDLSYKCKDSNVASYTDDITLYSYATETSKVAVELQAAAIKLCPWFKYNHLKGNSGKYPILLRNKKSKIALIDGLLLAASYQKKLIGAKRDSELKFENHMAELCLKVRKMFNAFCRIPNFVSLEKRRTLMKAELQFICPF